MKKKILQIIIILIVIVIIGFLAVKFLNKKPTSPMDTGTESSGIGEVEEQENTKESIVTGEMNDDIIIEIMAITKYIAMLNLTDPQAAQRATDEVELDGDIYEKFGVTEEEYYAYFDKISGQGELKEMKIMQGVQQRIVELQRTGL